MSNINASAHVCTATPLLQKSNIWLVRGDESHKSAALLYKHCLKLSKSALADAIFDGYWALTDGAKNDDFKAIQAGALLHIGVPAAIKQAQLSLEQERAAA